jgi:hypothetical protein
MSPESRFGTKRSPYSLSRSLMLFRRGLGDSGVVSEVVERVLSREGVEALDTPKMAWILGRFLR